jgi:hypothetical protein
LIVIALNTRAITPYNATFTSNITINTALSLSNATLIGNNLEFIDLSNDSDKF